MPALDPISGLLMLVIGLFDLVFGLVVWVIIASVVVSWLTVFGILNTRNAIAANILHTLDRLTEPMYRPIRKVIPAFGGMDLSPMVILLGVMFAQGSILPYFRSVIVYYATR